MLDFIWGAKTHAIFDVWSMEHMLSGLSVGHSIRCLNERMFRCDPKIFRQSPITQYFDIVVVLCLAYWWETIEHYLETGMMGQRVEDWFQGVEYWPNRIIVDPLLMLMGYLVIREKPGLVAPARLASLMWLAVHITVFPHSMYLHNFL